MKLQFKHQPFQAEAADAVCDVFCGQPYRTVTYRRDLGDLTGVQISTLTIAASASLAFAGSSRRSGSMLGCSSI